MGPFGLEDVFGYGTAITMVLNSREKGKYSKNFKQFDTIRHTRSHVSNVWRTSASHLGRGSAIGLVSDDNSSMTDFTNCPTQSLWFRRFTQGCRKRMGQDVRHDLGISIEVMIKLMEYFEEELKRAKEESNQQEINFIISVGCYSVLSYCASLRGPEGFLLDLSHLVDMLPRGEHESPPFVVAPLQGHFKSELGLRCHLLPMVSETRSGLQPRLWMERVVRMNAERQRTTGPAFADEHGRVPNYVDYEIKIFDGLTFIQDNCNGLIDPKIDVTEEYGIFRSFRRGSLTQATNQGVTETVVDAINRWRKFETAKGCMPSMTMRSYYAQIQHLFPTMLVYSEAL
jgi:hypothetical protein